ncbi:retrotransposon ORF1 [Tanacetum coccineum]
MDPNSFHIFNHLVSPSGGGLILYQTYGNLYAMTALGWLLEETHVTWAQLEKKRTRPRLYTNYLEEIPNSSWRRCRKLLATASGSFKRRRQGFLDGVTSNWLERLPTRTISIWEDLTTRFLAQFFSPGRTAKLRNDILMFHNIKENLFLEHGLVSRTYSKKRTIDQSADGKLRDKNAEESWALLEDLTIYDNESWNDPRDFAKPVKEISLPQDVPSTSDRRLIELKNQVQRLMDAHLAPKQHVQVNKISSSCEIYSGPHDTQYCMENPEQAFVEYASSRTNEAGDLEGLVSKFMVSQNARLSKFEVDFKQQQGEMTNKIDTVLKAVTDRITGALPSDMVKNSKLNVNFTSPVLKYDDSHEEGPEDEENTTTEGLEVEYFDTFSTRSELAYHKYLMSGPIPSLFLRNPIITEGCPSNLKIPYNIRHVHVEKAYIDLNSHLSVMTRMLYNWIKRRKLDPREDPNRGVSNFMGRIKGMYVFVGNFTYVIDFMIVKDISSIVDPRLSQVVLWKPFVEISNMTHDPSLGVVKFTDRIDKIAYKMLHKIKQYDSLSDLEKEHTKSVYIRNEEDKRRGVEYVMSKILGIYKECLELGPEYLTRVAYEGEVTLYLMRKSLEVPRKFPDDDSWRMI